jgi:hypothetical protein
MNTLHKALSLILLVLILVLPVYAQEATEEPLPAPVDEPILVDEPVVLETNELDSTANQFFTLISNATYLPFASGFVLLVIALLKRAPYIGNTNTNVLRLFVSVLVWAAYIYAKESGGAAQFESTISGLTTIGGAFLGVLATEGGSSKLFEMAKNNKVAILGHSKSPA